MAIATLGAATYVALVGEYAVLLVAVLPVLLLFLLPFALLDHGLGVRGELLYALILANATAMFFVFFAFPFVHRRRGERGPLLERLDLAWRALLFAALAVFFYYPLAELSGRIERFIDYPVGLPFYALFLAADTLLVGLVLFTPRPEPGAPFSPTWRLLLALCPTIYTLGRKRRPYRARPGRTRAAAAAANRHPAAGARSPLAPGRRTATGAAGTRHPPPPGSAPPARRAPSSSPGLRRLHELALLPLRLSWPVLLGLGPFFLLHALYHPRGVLGVALGTAGPTALLLANTLPFLAPRSLAPQRSTLEERFDLAGRTGLFVLLASFFLQPLALHLEELLALLDEPRGFLPCLAVLLADTLVLGLALFARRPGPGRNPGPAWRLLACCNPFLLAGSSGKRARPGRAARG